MDWASGDVTDVVKVISYLLPGFVAAWIFYGLTAHPKKSPFERVVQSLIFTAIIQGLTAAVAWGHRHLAADYTMWFDWTKDVAFVCSLINAVALGVFFAVCANHDLCHWVLRFLLVTKRTSYPSEWFSAFNKKKWYVTLHLEGSRRLYGWPVEWPDQPESGHFVIAEAAWVLDTNEMMPLHLVHTILIPATSVEMVEIMRTPSEVQATEEQIRQAEVTLVTLQRNEETNGKQSTATTATETDRGEESVRESSSQRAETANVTAATAKEMSYGRRKRRR